MATGLAVLRNFWKLLAGRSTRGGNSDSTRPEWEIELPRIVKERLGEDYLGRRPGGREETRHSRVSTDEPRGRSCPPWGRCSWEGGWRGLRRASPPPQSSLPQRAQDTQRPGGGRAGQRRVQEAEDDDDPRGIFLKEPNLADDPREPRKPQVIQERSCHAAHAF